MAEFKDSPTALIGDADCTGSGESLCSEIGVEGYPTIKYGDPNDLQAYEGGRTLEDLRTFAKDNLGPQCGPKNLDLCDDAKKADIAKYSAMSSAALDAFITEGEDNLEKAEADFKAFVGTLDKQMEAVAADEKDALLEKLQAEYTTKSEEKDAKVAEIKASGLGLAKAVKASTGTKDAQDAQEL